MSRRRQTFQKIALLFGLESKVNRDRFSGILRYTSSKANWEIRPYTIGDIDLIRSTPKSGRCAFWQPDGIILVGGNGRYADFRRFCERQVRKRIPCVVIDGDPRDRTLRPDGEVLTDDIAIGQNAAAYFLGKQFASFAYIATRDASELWHSDLRLSSYSKALQAKGLSCQVIGTCGKSDDRAMTIPEIAAQLQELPVPCAAFAYSDEVARYVLDACRYAGISVPETLSVLGVDDQLEITENTRPPLSSILPDFEGSGYDAAKMLDAILNGEETVRRILTTTIIGLSERSSTQDVRGGGRIVRIASEYIRLHLTEPIHTCDIGKALNLSPRLIEMRFRETLNCSVREKITALRIEKATQLMTKGDMPFAQIAYACGYSTPDGLKLAFRKRFGMTMSEWRQQNTSQGTDGAMHG